VTLPALEFRSLSGELAPALAALFEILASGGDTAHFHPHPFTREEAEARCRYRGDDLYYAAVAGGEALAYGMLRGWEQGFEIPSLGIALHPEARGTGLARAFMVFLHAAARRRGAARVRLKVYPDNAPAVRLYRALGYQFSGEEAGQLVGVIELP
jgi:ribosomal protein S18 acetylase RimI-like enzyme